MKLQLAVLILIAVCNMCPVVAWSEEVKNADPQVTTITLPAPTKDSKVTVEQALEGRRSIRTYSAESLTLSQVSQLLWAAQGITDSKGHRTAPSAQATYPLKLYLVAANVRDLPAGAYLYIPQGHKLQLVTAGDQRTGIGNQPQMVTAPALFMYVADYNVTGAKYGEKAPIFAAIEAGHSAQNILLEEVALGLIGVPMAGFDLQKTKSTLKLSDKQEPLYLVSAAKKG